MSAQPPTYDLMLLLDPQAEPETRSKIIADVLAAIAAGGELLRHDEWGERALTYPIDHKTSAEYHLFQLHASSPELLHGLNRSLGISDGIIRFRTVKLKPGTPSAPDMRPGHEAVARERTEAEAAPDVAVAEHA
jgi:small subunit ribosomal protein S6